MSGAAATGAIIAAAAAAAKKKKEREEEEKLTNYNNDDLENWEFKIVRSSNGSFKKPEFVQKVCAEESAAGWVMLEKFDNNRVRFKREVSHRRQDQSRQAGVTGADGKTRIIDPYRTSVGMCEGAKAGVIIGVVSAVIGMTAAVVYSAKSSGSIDIGIPIVALTIGAIAVAAVVMKKRGR